MRARAPICPGCGYDLAGVVASWREACPLEGVCSECGCALDWPDIVAHQPPPRWSFEHARRPRPRAALVTIARALEPVTFWRALGPDHHARPARVLLLAIALAAAALALSLAASLIVWWRIHASTPHDIGPLWVISNALLAAREPLLYLLVWHAAAAAARALDLRASRLPPAHAASEFLYGCIGLTAAALGFALTAIIDDHQMLVARRMEGPAETLGVLCIVAAWLWLPLFWFAATRARQTQTRHTIHWLVTQAAAALAVTAFGWLDDTLLPF